MAKHRRVRRDWPTVLQTFEDSGLSIATFCRQQGICRSLLYRWRQRLGAGAPSEDAFVELRPALEPRPGSGVTVVSDQGWRLELEPGFDEATLDRVLACVSRRGPCSP